VSAASFCPAEKRTITLKIPFFISPAYSVPKMTISMRLKLISTEVDEVMPAVNRLALYYSQ
jgi:hypothetical protein